MKAKGTYKSYSDEYKEVQDRYFKGNRTNENMQEEE